MNKTLRNIVTSAALLFSVSACATKCEFKDFSEAFVAAKREGANYAIEKTSVKGKISGDEVDFSFEKESDLTAGEIIKYALVKGFDVAASTVVNVESSSATYYKGTDFKVENGETTFKFDKYANLCGYSSGNDTNIKITYKYSKK